MKQGEVARGKRRTLKLVLGSAAGLILIAMIGFVVWAIWVPAPMPEAIAALESTDTVRVSQNGEIVFAPASADAATCGFIFYPGGRVDARAYAPALHAIAEAGYLTIAAPMPLNLAVLAPNRAAQIIEAHPAITHWAVGGHSLGGAMAVSFVAGNPMDVDGLALWAGYGTEGSSLAHRDDLAVTSIYASNDGLATLETIADTTHLLPEQAVFVQIEGGNHAQFGWYGDQRGDNPATITREEQQAQTVAATLAMLDAMCTE